jgi:hypothetical protein
VIDQYKMYKRIGYHSSNHPTCVYLQLFVQQ